MIVQNSTYNPPLIFKNEHVNTIYRSLFHQIDISYQRERINTSDGDFLDLDFLNCDSDQILIIIHGLEGSSDSKYIQNLALQARQSKMNVVAMNLRGCSGEPNLLYPSYHSGQTDDLETVVKYLLNTGQYKNIFLTGYSLGGNQILKWLGEIGELQKEIKRAVTVSVPCDLAGSSEEITKYQNSVYRWRFMTTLKEKLKFKAQKFPEKGLSVDYISKISTFVEFDNLYTAPAHGFKNAQDYYHLCSSKQFIPRIKTPTLLISSLDDTFLSESCYPIMEAEKNKNFYLELTQYGGHVGFNSAFQLKKSDWLEKRILNFLFYA